MSPRVQNLITFVLLLAILNLLMKDLDLGVHFSIVGSIVLTLVVNALVSGFGSGPDD